MRRPDLFSKKELPATLLVLVATAYFGATAARDLQPFDSAEFALNAAQFGVGHPPGQPLYLLLGALFVRILPLSAPWALSLLSALATIGALFVALRLARALGGRDLGGIDALLVGAACLLPGVWDMATRPEVYSLAALLLCGGAAALTRHISQAQQSPLSHWERGSGGPSDNRGVRVAGLLFGLGASVNPAMAIAVAAAVAPALIGWIWNAPTRNRLFALGSAIVAGLVGLLPYGLLPILGANPHNAVIWGEPLRGDALIHYLAGRDYRSWHLTAGEFAHNLAAALAWLLQTGQLPLILLGTLGFLRSPLPKPARIIPLLVTLLSLSLIALNHPFIPTNPDYDGYLLPAVWLSAAGLPLLAAPLRERPRGRLIAAALAVALGFFGARATTPLASRTRWNDHVTRDAARRLLDETPPRGVLVLEADHLVFPALYMTEVEHLRDDVLVVNAGWASSSWYLRHLAARHPDLPPVPAAPTRDERLAGFFAAMQRPVVAESAALAALAGRPALCRFVVAAGPCPSPANASDTPLFGALLDSRPGSLAERVACQTILQRADNALRTGDLRAAFMTLKVIEGRADLAGLPKLPDGFPLAAPAPRPAVEAALAARTRLRVPIALGNPALVVLRLGDLVAPFDPAAAADLYLHSDLPEAEEALARLHVQSPR